MKFFTFSQNNSGGNFHHKEQKGIGHYVIIEAKNEDDAIKHAESIGLYFNGCDDGRDCKCCGDRWSCSFIEGKNVPSIYDTDVSSLIYKTSWAWKIPSYIHYADGTVKKVEEVLEQRN